MARVAVVGDGPGGLSAALFLARGGHEVTVYGDDKSAMHFAQLNNYPGLPPTAGSAVQATMRSQAEEAGATLDERRVASLDSGLQVELTDGTSVSADYVILGEGRNHPVADAAGAQIDETGAIQVDREQRTSLPGVYAVGRSTRPSRSQAIISAGHGAVAALDILARESGGDVQDWDSTDD